MSQGWKVKVETTLVTVFRDVRQDYLRAFERRLELAVRAKLCELPTLKRNGASPTPQTP